MTALSVANECYETQILVFDWKTMKYMYMVVILYMCSSKSRQNSMLTNGLRLTCMLCKVRPEAGYN